MTHADLIREQDHRRRMLRVLARLNLPRSEWGGAWITMSEAPRGMPDQNYARLVKLRGVDRKRSLGDFTRAGRVRFRQAPDWVFAAIPAPNTDRPRIDTDCLTPREYLVARLLAVGNSLVSGTVALGLHKSGLHRAAAGLRRKVEAA